MSLPSENLFEAVLGGRGSKGGLAGPVPEGSPLQPVAPASLACSPPSLRPTEWPLVTHQDMSKVPTAKALTSRCKSVGLALPLNSVFPTAHLGKI